MWPYFFYKEKRIFLLVIINSDKFVALSGSKYPLSRICEKSVINVEMLLSLSWENDAILHTRKRLTHQYFAAKIYLIYVRKALR